MARFEAVGGLRTDGIFRVSADKDALDEYERQLFNSETGVDADGATARTALALLSDPHVRSLPSHRKSSLTVLS